MALNKKMTAWSLTLASTLLLAACGSDTTTEESVSSEAASEVIEESSEATSEVATSELQDGTYTLVQKNLDENGWKVDFTMVVEGGEITESNYDYKNEAGELKSEDQAYQDRMSEKVGVGPQEYLPELNNQLVEKQDASEVEVVSGATHSSDMFKEYAQQLIDAAKEGNTETIEIDN
ncbi:MULTISPECIES: FMN-binding protein [unclassified Jeotgalibaca]|uniref:FMN-binding protein n=1 Tax=unclassified Jeotgalibaca TaxID=2621505 RepID=UPI003FD53B34